MALNCLFCADVLRPLHLVPLTDFTYKYHPDWNWANQVSPCTVVTFIWQ